MNREYRKNIVEKVSEFLIPDISNIVSLYSQESIVRRLKKSKGYSNFVNPLNKKIDYINNFLCNEIEKDHCLNCYHAQMYIFDINNAIDSSNKAIFEGRNQYTYPIFRYLMPKLHFFYNLCYYPLHSQTLIEIRIRKTITACEYHWNLDFLEDKYTFTRAHLYQKFINYHTYNIPGLRALACRNRMLRPSYVLLNKKYQREKCDCEICNFSKFVLGEYFKENIKFD